MAAKGGDSKQGLIITLVFFVLLTIVLGVVSYYGFADQARLDDDKKKAVADKTAMEKSRDWEKFKALYFKTAAGFNNGKDDQIGLTALRDKYDTSGLGQGESDKAENDGVIKKIDAGMKWDQGQKRLASTYAATVATLEAEVDKLNKLRTKDQQAFKEYQDDHAKLVAAKDAALNKANADLAAANANNVKAQADKSKEFLASLDRISKQEQELDDLKKAMEQLREEKDKEKKRADKDVNDLRVLVQKTQAEIAPKNILKYEAPRGKIVSLDKAGLVAYVNLGSADNVRPQLTFSIVGADLRGVAKGEPKGSLEIANVLSEHLSVAKVTETVDPNRNPIMKDDLLFNPAWLPTQRQHVAIAGLIDLTGDGRDNTAEFIRNLESKYGIVVDAHLDLKDLTIKGPGMSFQTDYFVIGESPEFGSETVFKPNDTRIEKKMDINSRIAEMHKEATRLGATIIPFRRFVTLIGYKLPKAAMAPHQADFNLYRMAPAAPGKENTPAPNADDKPMAKDEKEK